MEVLRIAWESVAINVLIGTLSVLIVVIAYRQLLRFLGKGRVPLENYCVLYGLEENPVKGEVEFYFTSEEKKNVKIQLLDGDMEVLEEISDKECHVGGNIIRFDTSKLKNGVYYYCLRTSNQKTMKKMEVRNA